LVSTTLASATTTYAHDGDGVRTQASTGTQEEEQTNFLWDVNQPLPELVRESSA
jgi:hypothetical protein